ncbi:MAG: universal stress protein [Pseudomonadota bacterium]
MKKRKSFEAGHLRKFLLIVDDTDEVEAAVFYAANRVAHSGGSLVMLYIIEPQVFQHWMGVKQVQMEEETIKAKALFRLYRRKLNQQGFEAVKSEETIAEGDKADQIAEIIQQDEDIAILVLGAAANSKGPGPLVSSLASGSSAGSFPIPITIVPGNLTPEEIEALA